ncbi:hypothetical protein TH66_12080 [Carbonactinospora thermoautotrophica]|uniref:YcxB-like C-terminal domain-containing protein n=1 Tax=Carbonactinospora thermoautotrophica TaxID=1469144 RepID=A0A132NI17_9ACTN|nr:YcxB family protein [Carbonactinospora thermoautotrophica]KWX02465.1 hypothetical protein LI90_3508 [Carbonactinospora thermoautotrophica]KWX03582.1 hypothetical protein TH66_12080 [Carbonactinospora thermoautotrophica]KWX09729.1 hypothetical protein TR74_07845 [Carbonactinospora thermoautotrophica]
MIGHVNIRVEVQPDRKRAARALKAVRRGGYAASRLGGCVICLIGLTLLATDARAGTALLACGALMMFLPDLGVWLALRRHRHLLDRPVTLALTDTGVRTSLAELAWEAFRRVEETEEFWLLRTLSGRVITLPKQALAPEQRAELRTFLAGRGLLNT